MLFLDFMLMFYIFIAICFIQGHSFALLKPFFFTRGCLSLKVANINDNLKIGQNPSDEEVSGHIGEEKLNLNHHNINGVASRHTQDVSSGIASNIMGSNRDVRTPTAWWHQKETMEQFLALLTLLLQNTGMIVLMRISRVKTNGVLYDIRTAVMINEFMKLVVSTFLYVTKENGNLNDIVEKSKPLHLLKVMIPSALYVVQNNLQYVSVSNLPASVYQVLIQMKILTTAAVSEVLLGRKHNKMQWISLFSLFVGLSIVQHSLSAGVTTVGASTVGNVSIGLITVLVSCLTSATAGVYFEKVVKGTPEVGLWAFNTQMSVCSLLVAVISVLKISSPFQMDATGFALRFAPRAVLRNVPAVPTLLQGFTPLVYTIVTLQAMGGLVVSLVVKKTNSVVKGFATSGAVILSCLLSRFLFEDYRMGPVFYLGAAIVTTATGAFGRASPGRGK